MGLFKSNYFFDKYFLFLPAFFSAKVILSKFCEFFTRWNRGIIKSKRYMPDIDKNFDQPEKQEVSVQSKAASLDIPQKRQSAFRLSRLLKLAVPAVLLLVLLAGGVYYRYFSVREISAAFELTAKDSDAAGISPDSVFVLKSSKNITAVQVKKIVKINPVVDFEVKSEGNNRFQIRPLLKLSGNTIYQISIERGAAERDFAWAFQVRAPFAAISTFPRDKATGVPINSSIEAVFNREDFENVDGSFEITPGLPGRFEIHGDTIVFLPSKTLQEKIVYTATFKKGLSVKGSQEALAQNIVFSFETAETSYNPGRQLSFGQELAYFSENQTPTLQLYEYNVDFSDAQAQVYAFSNKEQFIQGYYASRKWDLGWAYYYKQNQTGYDTKNLQKISSFKPQIVKVDYQTFFQFPENLPKGYYLVDLKVGEMRRQAWVLINDISHYYSLSDQNGFVWAYQYSKKAPIDGATVAYYGANGQRRELGKTDKRGLFEFNLPDELKSQNPASEVYGQPRFLEIAPANMPASLILVSAGWWWNYNASSEQDNFWKYLSTDRFTYKLSDTIKFWGVVKGKARDYKNQQVKIQLRDGWYYYDLLPQPGFESQDRPLAESQAVISQFDTIYGEVSYKGVKPGTYQLLVLLNDKIVTQTSVEILDYVKPLYQITVTPDKRLVFAGQPVTYNVKAAFYDGSPVGALKLKYNAYYSSKNLSGELALNRRGEGKVTIVPEYRELDYYPHSLNISFSPALAEEGDIVSEASANTLIFGPDIYLQASQKYKDNNNFTITAKVNKIVLDQALDARGNNAQYPEYIGSPVTGAALTAEVQKTEYLQIEDGQYYDPINKTSNPKYRYEERKTIAGNYRGSTSGNGEWSFDINLPKGDRVYYTVKISGKDAAGKAIGATVWPYYYKDYGNYYSGATSSSNRAILSLGFEGGEKEYDKRFSAGEKVRLNAEAMEGGQFLSEETLFYRFGHSGIGNLRIVKGRQFEENFGDDFRPAVTYRAVSFGPYGFVESNSLLAAFKQSDAKLDISISPDKENYRPGETAKVAVEVKDKNGQSSGGEINVSVVDEAVFDILPYYWQQDILDSLYQIDYNEPRSQASDFAPAELSKNAGAEGGGCFAAGTQILLAGGKTKAIEDIKVGDVVLTRAGEDQPKILVAAIVQGISRHVVDDYLVINKSLKVTQEHRLYVNGKWLEAGLIKPGDRLQDKNGIDIIVESVEKVLAPKTLVYNFNAGKYHTYFAGGVYAHNAEKGGGFRSEFLDTAHFETKSLSGGKANFEFKLPDNITSWRVTASAFEPDKIFAGQKTKLLAATLPFFTDAVISQIYLAGDKPIVAARGFGKDYNPDAETSFELVVEGLDFKETKSVKGGMVEFNLPSLPVGNYELKLKAKQGNLEDGVLRKFQVVGSYFVAKQSEIANITSGKVGLPTGLEGYTDVIFTDQGKARFYEELLWNQYQSGKRADQITTSFVARQMLKDYFGQEGENPNLDLGAYYVPEGGIGLFTYGDSDVALSAKIADLAPDRVYQTQLAGYFKQTLRDDKADLSRIAKALYGLAALHQPVLTKLQLIQSEKDLSLEDQIYVALGFARLGDKETARKIYLEKIRPNLHFEAGQAWLDKENDSTKRVKLTAFTGVLAAGIAEDQDALSVWQYLQEHYPSEDLDILERFLIIRDEIRRLEQSEAGFNYELNGKKTEVKLKNGEVKTLKFSKNELSAIVFSEVKGEPAAVVVLENYQNPDQLKKNADLNVKREFRVNGKQVSEIKEGDTVVVHLEYQISQKAIDGAYQIVDYLPSGLRPLTNLWQRGYSYSYTPCYQKGEPLAIDGNKVYFSAYVYQDKIPSSCPIFTIEYYARAAAKGEFNVNPPLIQSLKNYDSLNTGLSQKVKIISTER